MLGGAIYLTAIGFKEIGGFQGLLDKYPQAVPTNVSAIVVNSTCHWPDPQAFKMLRDVSDDYMPWLGFLLGNTAGAIWYWCTDQVIVQRVLAAKSLSHAQGATLLASCIKMFPFFVMAMPGMISRILYPNEVACTNPDYCMEVCQSRAGCSNIAFPRLVLGLMPDGARGLMMAVMIAALMSDLDSIFNSSSTLFTMDIWRKFRKHASSTELMVVGRLFILVLVAVSIAWVPIIKEQNSGQVFIYIQEIKNYFAPPFAAIFLLAILVPMVNETGAFWALMLALVTGVSRLILAYMYKAEGYCGEKSKEAPAILANFQYMNFALFISCMTAVVAVVISYFTGRPHPKYLYKTTYWTRNDPNPPPGLELSPVGTNGKEENRNEAGDVTSVTVTTVSGSEDDGKNGLPDDTVQHGFLPPHSVIGQDKQQQQQEPNTCRRLFLRLVCGIHPGSGAAEDHEDEQQRQLRHHLQNLANMQQSRAERVGLKVGLVLTLSVAVGMYLFWSLYDFHEAPYYPEGAEYVLPGDERNDTMGIQWNNK